MLISFPQCTREVVQERCVPMQQTAYRCGTTAGRAAAGRPLDGHAVRGYVPAQRACCPPAERTGPVGVHLDLIRYILRSGRISSPHGIDRGSVVRQGRARVPGRLV